MDANGLPEENGTPMANGPIANHISFLPKQEDILIEYVKVNWPLSSVVKTYCCRCKRSGTRILGRSNQTQCCQRHAAFGAFLRSSVAQALNRGDGPRHSVHASA